MYSDRDREATENSQIHVRRQTLRRWVYTHEQPREYSTALKQERGAFLFCWRIRWYLAQCERYVSTRNMSWTIKVSVSQQYALSVRLQHVLDLLNDTYADSSCFTFTTLTHIELLSVVNAAATILAFQKTLFKAWHSIWRCLSLSSWSVYLYLSDWFPDSVRLFLLFCRRRRKSLKWSRFGWSWE